MIKNDIHVEVCKLIMNRAFKKDFLFLMWTILKVFMEFVVILLLFYALAFWQGGMWDLNSPTRDRIHTPYTGR